MVGVHIRKRTEHHQIPQNVRTCPCLSHVHGVPWNEQPCPMKREADCELSMSFAEHTCSTRAPLVIRYVVLCVLVMQ